MAGPAVTQLRTAHQAQAVSADPRTVSARPFSGTSMVRKNTKQANNKMQQTRSGHSRWRPSLLILVLARPQEAIANVAHDPS